MSLDYDKDCFTVEGKLALPHTYFAEGGKQIHHRH